MLIDKNKPEFSCSLEKSFQEHIEPEKVRIMRVMAALGATLYLLFFIVDFWAIPSALQEVYLIRSVVISGLIISYMLTYTRVFIKYYNWVLPVPYLLASMGIEAMIYVSTPSDHASNTYFAGIILVIMILFAWSHLKKSILIGTTAVIIGMYIAIEVGNRGSNVVDFLPVLLPNLFFLVSAAIIGLVTQFIRDSYLRQNFFLQERLKESLDEKTEEANDNAYLANHDALTDLPNRRYIGELLNESLELAEKTNQVLVIMFVDLNGFKQVNDVYGHNAGDEVLVIVAKRLELAIRNGDHLSRLGGDEYLIGLLMEKDNLEEIEEMKQKFIHLISQPMNVEGLRIKVGASIGMAAYPMHGNSIDALIDIADKRMYQVKKGNEKKAYYEDTTYKNQKESVVIFPGNSRQT